MHLQSLQHSAPDDGNVGSTMGRLVKSPAPMFVTARLACQLWSKKSLKSTEKQDAGHASQGHRGVYLEHITLNSYYPLDEDGILFPKVCFFLQGSCCWMKNNNITGCRTPGVACVSQQKEICKVGIGFGQEPSQSRSSGPDLENL